MKPWKNILLISVLLFFLGCEKKKIMPGGDETDELISGSYSPTDYTFDIPDYMPTPVVPAENPMTQEGVALGRMLFYDPIFSADSTLSCAGCHDPKLAFTDGKALSTGILGVEGKRSSMSLVNLAYNTRGFFWDGRSRSLEEQALIPIEDHTEMADTWENVEDKLRRHDEYPRLFRAAFGIERKSELTRDLAVKAIAQFERTLISAQSRYDKVIWESDGFPTDSEQRGIALFFIEDDQSVEHPGCSHCHFNPLFTDNQFRNNGLDSVATLNDFEDKGLGGVNGNIFDNGKFRVPTLRNIALTAPYMHDGRFNTLEEVLDSYSRGGHGMPNEDANILPFTLTEQDKADLIAFMEMLTDTSFINNPDFSNPFQ
jgi:cytochrome c peroxidase